MKGEAVNYMEPFEFFVVALFNPKTGKVEMYYKDTWTTAKSPIEAKHFHTHTWAQKRAAECRERYPHYQAKIVRYGAAFQTIGV